MRSLIFILPILLIVLTGASSLSSLKTATEVSDSTAAWPSTPSDTTTTATHDAGATVNSSTTIATADALVVDGVSRTTLAVNALGIAVSDQFEPHGAALDKTREANICFFLQLSASSLPLTPRLIDRLWHPKNIILVHIDAKADAVAVEQLTARYSAPQYTETVRFLPRVPITYAGVTMLLNTISAMEEALTLAQSWDYFINLSGSDYPTISVGNLRVLLGQRRILQQQVSFLQMTSPEDFMAKMKVSRFNLFYNDPALFLAPGEIRETRLKLKRRIFNDDHQLGFRFMHSEAWLMAHRTLVSEAARGAFARRLLVALGHMMDPEEHFWPMLATNLPHLNRTLARHAGRAIIWQLDNVMAGQHPFVVDKPAELERFWAHIQDLHNMLFLRKFATPNSPLMDRIDRRMSGVHPETRADEPSVMRFLRKASIATLCYADVERHYYGKRKCLTGSNYDRGASST